MARHKARKEGVLSAAGSAQDELHFARKEVGLHLCEPSSFVAGHEARAAGEISLCAVIRSVMAGQAVLHDVFTRRS